MEPCRCVLFTAEDQRVVNVVWERLAAAKLESEPSLLFGQVTYEDSPNLFKRFGLEHTQLPAARLFRTRKVVFSCSLTCCAACASKLVTTLLI